MTPKDLEPAAVGPEYFVDRYFEPLFDVMKDPTNADTKATPKATPEVSDMRLESSASQIETGNGRYADDLHWAERRATENDEATYPPMLTSKFISIKG